MNKKQNISKNRNPVARACRLVNRAQVHSKKKGMGSYTRKEKHKVY